MAHEFAHEPDALRYALRIDGDLACILDYSLGATSINLTRSFTQPPQRGHGYAAELVEFAVNDIETTTSNRIIPRCWYVADWFDAHPARADLLTR